MTRCFTTLLPLACLAALTGCPARPAVRPPSAASAAGEELCGNGRVDPGERCDPNVRWAEQCPAPWGLCWKCNASCQPTLPTVNDPHGGLPPVAFCEETTPYTSASQTYDAHGNLLTHHKDWPTQDAKVRSRFQYDAGGHRVVDETTFWQGTRETFNRTHHEYDPSGRRVLSREDHDRDGKPDREWRYEYGSEGPPLRIWSTGPDGKLQSDRRFSYSQDWLVIADVSTFPDNPWHASTIRAYDFLGREIYEALGPSQRLAAPSYERLTTYTPGGSRQCLRSAQQEACWTTNRQGHKLEHWSQGPGLPRGTARHRHEYDPRGLLTRSTSLNEDGTLARVDHYHHDAHGNLLRQEQDHNGDGTLDGVALTRTYDCLEQLLPRLPSRGFTERTQGLSLNAGPAIQRRGGSVE